MNLMNNGQMDRGNANQNSISLMTEGDHEKIQLGLSATGFEL